MAVHPFFQSLNNRYKFVIMSRKKSLCSDFIMDVFANRPRDRHPVVSTSTATYFIEDYQASFCRIIDNVRSLLHLNHECTLASYKVVRSTDARENSIC